MDYAERLARFHDQIPSAFLNDFVAALEGICHTSAERASEVPYGYGRYIRPHDLRTFAEIAFINTASKHGLAAHPRQNPSRDPHAAVFTDGLVLTLSRTPAPSTPPRRAKFRTIYASVLTNASQYRLPDPYFQYQSDPSVVMLRDDDPRLYALVSYGLAPRKPNELGFVMAHFVDASGSRYFGKGIDLLAAYRQAVQAQPEENVPEPMLRPQSGERQEKGGAAS